MNIYEAMSFLVLPLALTLIYVPWGLFSLLQNGSSRQTGEPQLDRYDAFAVWGIIAVWLAFLSVSYSLGGLWGLSIFAGGIAAAALAWSAVLTSAQSVRNALNDGEQDSAEHPRLPHCFRFTGAS